MHFRAPDTHRHHRHGEGHPFPSGPVHLPTAFASVGHRPAHNQLREHDYRPSALRRRRRTRGVPSCSSGQRTLTDVSRPGPSGSALLHPLRGLFEHLPRLCPRRWPRLRLGLPRSHRRGGLSHAGRPEKGQRTPSSLKPLRRLPGSVSHQDRHTQDVLALEESDGREPRPEPAFSADCRTDHGQDVRQIDEQPALARPVQKIRKSASISGGNDTVLSPDQGWKVDQDGAAASSIEMDSI